MRRRARLAALLLAIGAAASTTGAVGPLDGVVLEDDTGRAWRLADLTGEPVLLVVADRAAAADADAWGTRLADAGLPLAPWRAEKTVACLAVADLRRVPEYARNAARARVRERNAARPTTARRACSPLLLDWSGEMAQRLRADRARVLVALLAVGGRVLLEERGPVTDAGLTRLRETIAATLRR